ncbi:SprT family zinc-dependent metalloprotease [Cognatilysobacter lacus]|uniref:M48 family metallopeptidase n=1 Tax=Cognatilysobacter lacus TaxID=1643323 RepID=A0A5D8Z4N4_9GAMM|nr:SprT family zinc-dependent metalloprotease [Lysobacter lacus]TZF89878.1 M48 family metallopeptidase [Lysobacter lacus]
MFLRARPPRTAPASTHAAVLQVTLPDGRIADVRRVDNTRVSGLKLVVTERGIRLTVPPRTSDRRALAFVQQHAGWIAGQLQHTFNDVQPLRIGQSASLPLRGADVPLHWKDGRFLRVELVDDAVVATVPANAKEAGVRKAVHDFYLSQARADVGRWLPTYLASLPRAPRSIAILPLTSLWGSLAANDRMRLDLALVLAPSAAFEYVLVHELCHLIEANHSAAFWAEVAQRFPDWKPQRDLLRAKGRPLKAALRAIRDPGVVPGA